MDPGRPGSPSQLPASNIKYHHPYFSPEEVEYLSEKQRGKMSVNQDKLRQQACSFIEAVSIKIGFPRKTIATAQSLYHRFHLFYPFKDFNYWDVTMACLYVSAKMHDTLKKPRDILMVSYTVRFPELAARSKVAGGDVDIDPATLEQDRQHLLGIERLVLETISFNFTVHMPFPYVIKLGREIRAPKSLTRLAWKLAIDSNRTLVPLQFPPHVVALACIFLAAFILSFEQPPEAPSADHRTAHELCALFDKDADNRDRWLDWEMKYKACLQDIHDICCDILDLMISAAQTSQVNTSTTNSPSTPSSPPRTPHQRPSSHLPLPQQQRAAAVISGPESLPFKHDALMRLKVELLNRREPLLPISRTDLHNERSEHAWVDWAVEEAEMNRLGKNEGTVRFVFGPERIVCPKKPLNYRPDPNPDEDEERRRKVETLIITEIEAVQESAKDGARKRKRGKDGNGGRSG